MSRSVSSFSFSASSLAFSASNRRTFAAWDSARPGAGLDVVPAVVAPEPCFSTHSRNAPREIPRSAAMPFNVAPGVDSYKSTARCRNSSV